MAAISTCQPVWLKEVIDGYAVDDEAKNIMNDLASGSNMWPLFCMYNGLIHHNGKI